MAISEFPNKLTRNWQKIWSETMVFLSQLRQFPQIIIALDKYTGFFVYVSTKLDVVIICCYGDIVYHKH